MAKNIEMQYYNGTSYEVCYPKVLMTNITGTLPLANGGTGASTIGTSAGANAIVKLSEDKSNMWYVNTASGAMYATAANGLPKFGTLPIAQGGTGATSASAALTALGAASASTVSTLSSKVSTLESKSSAFSLKLIHSESFTKSQEYGTAFTFSDMTKSFGLLTYVTTSMGYTSDSSSFGYLMLCQSTTSIVKLTKGSKYGGCIGFCQKVGFYNETWDASYNCSFMFFDGAPYVSNGNLNNISSGTIHFTSDNVSSKQYRFSYQWGSSGKTAGNAYLYSVEVNI